MVTLLLANKVNPNIQNKKDQNTILDIAIIKMDLERIIALLDLTISLKNTEEQHNPNKLNTVLYKLTKSVDHIQDVNNVKVIIDQ